MEVLSVKGFGNVSIADLTSAAGLDHRTLHKAFGTRDQILRAAIQFCADTEASLAHEPLRVLPTGREAIVSMLEENVRLRQLGRNTAAVCLRLTPALFLQKRRGFRSSWRRGVVRFRTIYARGFRDQ